MRHAAVLIALAVLCAPATALTPNWPEGTERVHSETAPVGMQRVPHGPFGNGTVPVDLLEGSRVMEVFQTPGPLVPSEVALALVEQFSEAGFEPVFDCADHACGGFDFRFALTVVPEPEMYVDLGNYHFSTFRSDDLGAVTVLISTAAERGYIQLTRFIPGEAEVAMAEAGGPLPAAEPNALPLADALDRAGRAVLDDLSFATGSSDLDGGEFESLGALAAYLEANPNRTVTLVGHTDAEGSLDANIRLSERRAASVRGVLVETYGIAANRIAARGVGFLAPRHTNATEECRTQNRRVEVVLNEP